MTRPFRILALLDAGHTPAAIAAALSLPTHQVYTVLRRERPNRARAARRSTSLKPHLARGLFAAGVSVSRVAALLEISTTYVYRALQRAHGARSPIGHRASNMIERHEVYPTLTDPEHRKRMEQEISKADAELAKLALTIEP